MHSHSQDINVKNRLMFNKDYNTLQYKPNYIENSKICDNYQSVPETISGINIGQDAWDTLNVTFYPKTSKILGMAYYLNTNLTNTVDCE